MYPKSIGQVLREELKKTTTFDNSTQDSNPAAEKSFDEEFCRWPFEKRLADSYFEIQADHVLDEQAFLEQLASQPTDKYSSALFNALPAFLQKRLRSGEWDDSTLQDVLREINRLMAGPARVFTSEVEERFDANHKDIVGRFKKFSPLVWNRLYLEAALPELLVCVWDTLPVIFKWIHAHPKTQHNALCLSGGGIRSATFGLGVLQGLARLKVLPTFQYLSTVSGGGYIGSWL